MGYGLGVDLGTTHTAAAVNVDGRVEAVELGSHRPEIPSLVYLRPDGEVLVGEAAQRRGEADPTRLAREFKRRLGDPVPIMLGGAPLSAHALTARLLSYVVEAVSRSQEAAPARIVVTHPANWGPYKRELLMQAVQLADLAAVTLRPEPQAAAVRFASTARVEVGETVAVYDLGGGTFDAAVLRKSANGFVLLGEPSGIEQLGGIDFDEAILDRVRASLGDDVLAGLDPDDDKVTEALARLRRDCVEAKESLSFDTEAVIAVALPRLHTRVQIDRADFEAMISPAVDEVLRKALSPIAKKRWASASTFATALGRALERTPTDIRLPTRLATEDPVRNVEFLLEPTSGIEAVDPPSLHSARVVTGHVRAAHLRVLSRLLQAHLGESGVAKLINETPHLAHAFAPTLALHAWIDLSDLIEAFDRARERVPSQLVPRKVGRSTMNGTFAQFFGADPTTLAAEKVLAALPTFWARYHDWGGIEADVHPGSAEITLGGYAGSPDVCMLVAAELERIVELTGAHAVGSMHPSCACTGGKRCEYRLTWTPAG